MFPDRLRQLPYLVHTNRELGLMLRGIKPLAYFSDFVDREPDCVRRYHSWFGRHVAAGRLTRRQGDDVELGQFIVRRVLYSLPGEEWRIDAMLTLVRLSGAWTRDRERRFGELLGYAPWQNDIWLTKLSSWGL